MAAGTTSDLQSDERALKLLETIAPAENGMSISEISTSKDLPLQFTSCFTLSPLKDTLANYPIGSMHQDREPFWHRRIDAILYQEIKRMTMNNTDTGLNADSAAFRKTLGKS